MYFIPQKSTWYAYIIHRAPHIWYSITGVFLCMLIALWYYIVFWPGQEKIHLLHTQLKTHYATFNTLIKTASQLTTQKEIDDLTQTISIYKTDCPHNQLTHLGTHVLSTIEDSGLQLLSYELIGTKAINWYQRAEISISTRGSIAAFDTFFSHLASQPLCIYCPNFTLTKENSEYIFQGILRSCIML